MNNIKDIILENLTMNDILKYYNIKRVRNMFCCPFHNDKTPSAKAYEKTYFCFGCGKRWRFNTIHSKLF